MFRIPRSNEDPARPDSDFLNEDLAAFTIFTIAPGIFGARDSFPVFFYREFAGGGHQQEHSHAVSAQRSCVWGVIDKVA